MKNRNRMKKVLAFVLTACFMLNSVCPVYAKVTEEWSTYYASGGGNGETDRVELPYNSDGYVLTCSSISGNCTEIVGRVTAFRAASPFEQLSLDRTVAFTRTATISFKVTTPINGNVDFHITMSHSGGSTAYMNGTISTVD